MNQEQNQQPSITAAVAYQRRQEIRTAIKTLGVHPGITLDQVYNALHVGYSHLVIGIGSQEKAGIHRILKKMGYIIQKRTGTITAIPHPNGEVTIQRMVRTIEGQARRIQELEDEIRHWQKEAYRNHPGKVSQTVSRAMATYGEVD
jgi:hypothetical protein